jgi:hypothetical protein
MHVAQPNIPSGPKGLGKIDRRSRWQQGVHWYAMGCDIMRRGRQCHARLMDKKLTKVRLDPVEDCS